MPTYVRCGTGLGIAGGIPVHRVLHASSEGCQPLGLPGSYIHEAGQESLFFSQRVSEFLNFIF
jgi:hypothetical protein